MSLLISLAWLVGWGMILLAVRFYWMGNKPPNFSKSDNPAADSPHFLTRALTFLYLSAVNAWLLLCPDKLSFDWSMDAIPLLRSITDWRNLHSVLFYLGFALLSWFGLRNPSLQSSKISEANGKSYVSNGKSATNGYSHNHDDNHYRDSNSPKRNGYHKPPKTPQNPFQPLRVWWFFPSGYCFCPSSQLLICSSTWVLWWPSGCCTSPVWASVCS